MTCRLAILLICLSLWASGAALLPPRQAALVTRKAAFYASTDTNRVDYISSEKVIGLTRYRYHSKTWATNVFSVVDITNIPMAPVIVITISWPAPIVLQISPDLESWSQLKSVATTTVALPIASKMFFKVPLPGQVVRITIDPSISTNSIGSNLYIGTNSSVYFSTNNIGTNVNYLVSGLNPGQVYYFAVKAYTNDGTESDFSNEEPYFTPLIEINPTASPKP